MPSPPWFWFFLLSSPSLHFSTLGSLPQPGLDGDWDAVDLRCCGGTCTSVRRSSHRGAPSIHGSRKDELSLGIWEITGPIMLKLLS